MAHRIASDALKIAAANPTREVVFFAIGFETTTPPTALAIRAAEAFGANLVPDDAPFDPMAMLSTPDAAHDRACELAGAGWLNQP